MLFLSFPGLVWYRFLYPGLLNYTSRIRTLSHLSFLRPYWVWPRLLPNPGLPCSPVSLFLFMVCSCRSSGMSLLFSSGSCLVQSCRGCLESTVPFQVGHSALWGSVYFWRPLLGAATTFLQWDSAPIWATLSPLESPLPVPPVSRPLGFLSQLQGASL